MFSSSANLNFSEVPSSGSILGNIMTPITPNSRFMDTYATPGAILLTTKTFTIHTQEGGTRISRRNVNFKQKIEIYVPGEKIFWRSIYYVTGPRNNKSIWSGLLVPWILVPEFRGLFPMLLLMVQSMIVSSVVVALRVLGHMSMVPCNVAYQLQLRIVVHSTIQTKCTVHLLVSDS